MKKSLIFSSILVVLLLSSFAFAFSLGDLFGGVSLGPGDRTLTDTDDGDKPNVAGGIFNGRKFTKTDYCKTFEPNDLVEYYLVNGRVKPSSHTCEFGCSDFIDIISGTVSGKASQCIAAGNSPCVELTVTDHEITLTDSGDDPFNAGLVEITFGTTPVFKPDKKDGKSIVESYCDENGQFNEKSHNCPGIIRPLSITQGNRIYTSYFCK